MNDLRNHKLYHLARSAKRSIRQALRQLGDRDARVISLKPLANSKGNVLLCTSWTFSFATRSGARKYLQQILGIAADGQNVLDLGYSVDVIHWEESEFLSGEDDNLLIDVRSNLQRLAPEVGKDCLKIQHIDVCHILYQNAAESRRLLDLQQRKGFTLQPRRFELPNLAIEYADCATVLGNEFTLNTFDTQKSPYIPSRFYSLLLLTLGPRARISRRAASAFCGSAVADSSGKASIWSLKHSPPCPTFI